MKKPPRKIAVTSRGKRARPKPPTRPSSAEGPRKFEAGDRVVMNGKAPTDYRGREGFVTELGPGRSEYRVEFDDGRRPTTGYMLSSWLTAEP